MDNNPNPFHNLPDLETERLLLRGLRPEDAPDMFEYASDPKVARFTTWSAHTSVEDSRAFLEYVTSAYRNPEVPGWTWGIVVKDTGKLIGTFGLDARPRDRRAEIGYAIGSRYWGQGYVTEAARAVLDYAFAHLPLNRIEAQCLPENIGSARVMEKAGMTYEGTLRERMVIKGEPVSLKMYSILRNEHEQQQDRSGKG